MTITARPQPRVRRANWPAIIAVLALAVLALGLWAYTATRPKPALVARRDIVAIVPLASEIITPPQAQAEVAAPFQAPVERVFGSVGARVRKGDVLVELSYPSGKMAYEQTRERVRAAEQALANARQQYDAPVKAAEAELARARSVEQAARKAASTGAATAGTEVPTTTGTPPSLEQATTDAKAAEQVLMQARADRQAALMPYERELETAREALREAQSGAKIASIRAPIDGTVLQLNAAPGQEVGGDKRTPVAVIVDLGALQVQASMKPEQSSLVKQGLPVTLTIEQVPNVEFPGTVSRIVTRPGGALGGQQYLALIDFKNEQGLVKPGMKGTAAVHVGEARDVLAAPSDAIDLDRTGRPTVKVLRNGRWQTVVVQPGLSDGHYTEIKSGLQEGDQVQVTPDLV